MAKNILLVKTSSLGDVIHAMPAVSDVYSQSAAGGLDWVVEESLQSIARLHSGVRNVIPVAIRRWRGSWWRSTSRIQIIGSLRRLRVQEYDAIIDAQGLFKSALLALAARGRRYGLDFHSSREPLGVFYHHTFRVPWELHAVERNRLLMAKALGSRVYAGPVKEIGWGRVELTGEGAASCLSPLQEADAVVLHWHGDTFDLPDGAERLASNQHYQNQAFAHGRNALALQFHLEADPHRLEQWYVGHTSELGQSKVPVSALRAETMKLAPGRAALADRVFSRWLRELT